MNESDLVAERNIVSLFSKGDCISIIKDMYPGRCEELGSLLQVTQFIVYANKANMDQSQSIIGRTQDTI